LDPDVDLGNLLGKRVDLDKAGVDGAVETSELGDETNMALVDGLVRVWAADTAWDGSDSSDACTNGVD